MSQAEDLLNTLADEGTDDSQSSGVSTSEEHIVVNADRTITVPESLKNVAIQYDHHTRTVTFDCPRYWDDGMDLAEMNVYITYSRPDGVIGSCPVSSKRIDENDDKIIHFDWSISRSATLIRGYLSFNVCAKKAIIGDEEDFSDGIARHITLRWNSALSVDDLYISEGLTYDITPEDVEYVDNLEEINKRLDDLETSGMALDIATESVEGGTNIVINTIGKDTQTVFIPNGINGDSSEITMEDVIEDGIKTGTKITVTDAKGSHEYVVLDGKDGKDGRSYDFDTEELLDENDNKVGTKLIIQDEDGTPVHAIHIKDGRDGEDAATPEVNIGSVRTVSSYDDAYVYCVNEQNNVYKFNFGIPRGPAIDSMSTESFREFLNMEGDFAPLVPYAPGFKDINKSIEDVKTYKENGKMAELTPGVYDFYIKNGWTDTEQSLYEHLRVDLTYLQTITDVDSDELGETIIRSPSFILPPYYAATGNSGITGHLEFIGYRAYETNSDGEKTFLYNEDGTPEIRISVKLIADEVAYEVLKQDGFYKSDEQVSGSVVPILPDPIYVYVDSSKTKTAPAYLTNPIKWTIAEFDYGESTYEQRCPVYKFTYEGQDHYCALFWTGSLWKVFAVDAGMRFISDPYLEGGLLYAQVQHDLHINMLSASANEFYGVLRPLAPSTFTTTNERVYYAPKELEGTNNPSNEVNYFCTKRMPDGSWEVYSAFYNQSSHLFTKGYKVNPLYMSGTKEFEVWLNLRIGDSANYELVKANVVGGKTGRNAFTYQSGHPVYYYSDPNNELSRYCCIIEPTEYEFTNNTPSEWGALFSVHNVDPIFTVEPFEPSDHTVTYAIDYTTTVDMPETCELEDVYVVSGESGDNVKTTPLTYEYNGRIIQVTTAINSYPVYSLNESDGTISYFCTVYDEVGNNWIIYRVGKSTTVGQFVKTSKLVDIRKNTSGNMPVVYKVLRDTFVDNDQSQPVNINIYVKNLVPLIESDDYDSAYYDAENDRIGFYTLISSNPDTGPVIGELSSYATLLNPIAYTTTGEPVYVKYKYVAGQLSDRADWEYFCISYDNYQGYSVCDGYNCEHMATTLTSQYDYRVDAEGTHTYYRNRTRTISGEVVYSYVDSNNNKKYMCVVKEPHEVTWNLYHWIFYRGATLKKYKALENASERWNAIFGNYIEVDDNKSALYNQKRTARIVIENEDDQDSNISYERMNPNGGWQPVCVIDADNWLTLYDKYSDNSVVIATSEGKDTSGYIDISGNRVVTQNELFELIENNLSTLTPKEIKHDSGTLYFNWKGMYNPSDTYGVNDIVIFTADGLKLCSFQCLQDGITGIDPMVLNGDKWELNPSYWYSLGSVGDSSTSDVNGYIPLCENFDIETFADTRDGASARYLKKFKLIARFMFYTPHIGDEFKLTIHTGGEVDYEDYEKYITADALLTWFEYTVDKADHLYISVEDETIADPSKVGWGFSLELVPLETLSIEGTGEVKISTITNPNGLVIGDNLTFNGKRVITEDNIDDEFATKDELVSVQSQLTELTTKINELLETVINGGGS